MRRCIASDPTPTKRIGGSSIRAASTPIAAGLDAPITVEIEGHVGYYCAGMNKEATIILNGNAGQGVAENMMSGRVHVKGDASQAAGATGCGGLLVVDGNASARCGISMKGIDIVVKGSVGHLVRLHGAGRQPGRARRCRRCVGRFDLRGAAVRSRQRQSLGADCIEKPLDEHHKAELARLLDAAGLNGASIPARSGATAPPASSIISTSTTSDRTDGAAGPLDPYAAASVGDFRRILHRRNPPRRRDRHLRHPRLRGETQAAAFRRSACSSALRSAAIRWKAIARNAGPT